MKKLFILVLLAAVGFWIWKKTTASGSEIKPLYPEPYVAIYGQDADTWTQNYIRRLSGMGISCIYRNLDQPEVGTELYSRIQEAKLGSSPLIPPIVDVNGRILIRPRMADIVANYNKKAPGGGVVWSADSEGTRSQKPYVVVYGRDSCGWTKKSLADLRNTGIPCTYKKIDRFEVEEELYWRMKEAGLETGSFDLPVIDVNGKVLIRPGTEEIVALFRTSGE